MALVDDFDYTSFLPVVEEDADSVRARFDADANAGVDPSDPAFIDTTVGGWYWDLTQPAVLEDARLWDFLGTELVAASFPATAWGDWLDLHGQTVGLTREDEVASKGTVLFTGDVGLLIPAGTEVSTVQPDPSAETDPVIFSTDVTITLAATPGPVNLAAAPHLTGGALAADSYWYVVSAINAGGQETVVSNEVSEVVSGATSSIDLAWTAFTGATAYKIYRSKIQGAETLLAQIPVTGLPTPTGLAGTPSTTGGSLAAGTRHYVVTALDAAGGETAHSTEITVTVAGSGSSKVALTWNRVDGASKYRVYEGGAGAENIFWETTTNSYTDTGAASTGGTPPTTNSTSTTRFTDIGADTPGPQIAPTNTVSVTAETAGAAGNVAAGTITQVLSPLPKAPTVSNPSATSGGADVESDARFRQRIEAEYSKPSGAGNIADYINWALSIPQVGYVTVQPLWNGAGTVRVIVTDSANHALPSSVVAAVQDYLDPIPGQGAGQAPIGANVTVVTATGLPIDVSAKFIFDLNYSLDGAGGTIPLRDTINRVLNDYLNTLPPGDDVILTAVVRQLMSVPGVIDVQGPGGTGLPTLNTVSANVVVGALQVAEPGTYTLSA